MYGWPYQPLLPGGEQLDAAGGATTTPISATATAVGVASVTLQVSKIITATAVGVPDVTLLYIAAPAATAAADTARAEPLLVNPGQWIKA